MSGVTPTLPHMSSFMGNTQPLPHNYKIHADAKFVTVYLQTRFHSYAAGMFMVCLYSTHYIYVMSLFYTLYLCYLSLFYTLYLWHLSLFYTLYLLSVFILHIIFIVCLYSTHYIPS